MHRGKVGTLPVGGGKALKKAIHVARARAGITSDMQLSMRSGVHYDTFMNWYSGKTRPRGAELQRVATTLGVPFATLEAAYEGRDPEPQPLQDAVRDLTGAIREQVDRDSKQPDLAAAMTAQAEALNRLAVSIDAMADQVTRRVGDGVTAFEDVVRLLRSQQPTDEGVSPDANGRAR